MTNKQMTYKVSLGDAPFTMEKATTYENLFPLVPDTKQTMNETSSSSETQVGGSHYKKCTIQPWDYTIANDLDYFQGSIIKYVTRWKDKGWIQDLYKARHFLDKYIETMEEKHKSTVERPE